MAVTVAAPMITILASTSIAQVAIPPAKTSVQPPPGQQTARAAAMSPDDSAESNASPARGSYPSVRPPVRLEVPPKPRRVVKPAVPQDAAINPASPVTSVGVPANMQVARAPEVRKGTPSHSPAAGPAATPAPRGQETSPAPAAIWSEAEIKEAKAYCENVLRGVDAAYVADDPIKQGECGSPAVFKVSSIGKGPAIELLPPVQLTCDMIAALDKWSKRELQPQARALLGSPIVRMETMSSYSCRNAYGRTKSRLSEHGRANAIDIAGFSTAKDTMTVLASWGLTAREVKALAAKQEAERAAAAQAQAKLQGGAPASTLATGTLPTGVPGTIAPLPGSGRIAPPAFGLAPTRLGGPKAAEKSGGAASAQSAPKPALDGDVKQRFLREVHAAACKHFGTVLGPEANNAHKNHFHFDMAPRKITNFCE